MFDMLYGPIIGWYMYNETPLIQTPGEQLNLFDFEGLRIKGG